MMLSRSSFARNAPRALQKQCSVTAASGRRGMASATQFDVSESSGVKVANRETAGPTGTLALVAKAGSRYQPFPGFAEALDEFAFKVSRYCPNGRSHRLYSIRFNQL
jgi:ubiquinol-cytochrome c reductase core subunit 2